MHPDRRYPYSSYGASCNKRWSVAVGVGMLLVGVLGMAAEPAAPTPMPASRYARMSEHSPFALATPTAPPEAPKVSFAANWYLSGLGRVGEEEFVAIKSRDLSSQFSLHGHELNEEHGVRLVKINWPETGRGTATIQKGQEMATVEFNEKAIRAAPKAAQGVAANRTPAGTVPAAGSKEPKMPAVVSAPPTPAPMVTQNKIVVRPMEIMAPPMAGGAPATPARAFIPLGQQVQRVRYVPASAGSR